MTAIDTIRVLLIEDHVYTCQGLRDLLSATGTIQVVGEAATAEAGLAMAARLRPNIILLDLHLKNGPPASELLEAFCIDQPWKVIVFSAEERTAFVKAAMDLGAAAFLSKAESPERLIACIRTLANSTSGKPVISDNLNHNPVKLSPALEELVKLLGKGLKYHEIAALKNSSPEGVRKQCDRLLIKLGLASREQLIAWAVEHGYTSVD